MNIPRKTQWWLIIATYAAVTACSAVLILQRYLLYKYHAQEASAASGMYAFGDEILIWFICFLFLAPTFFLLRLLANYESAYDIFSRIVFAVGLTAPLSLGWLYMTDVLKTELLQGPALTRLFRAPLILIFIGVSRWMARTKLAKQFTSWALLSESAVLVTSAILLFGSAGSRK